MTVLSVLAAVLAAPVASRDMLTTAGVTWPAGADDPQRKPDYSTRRRNFEDTGDGQIGFTFA